MASTRPRKAVILGLDSVTPVVLRRLIAEGVLPNLKALIERGVFAEALAPVPGLTHCNWVSIATGAWPSTHGVSCHTVHMPGEPLDVVHNAHTSEFSKAEFLWDAAERVGKRSILMKYLCSWPPTIRQGWQVSGHGNPDSPNAFVLGPGRAHSTRDETDGLRFKHAEGWQHLPPELTGAKEASLEITTWRGESIRWWLLLGCLGDGASPTVTIAPTKDYSARLCSLAQGEWSQWLPVQTPVGEQRREARVRLKVMELAGDGSSVALFQTDLLPTGGFTYPDELAAELLEVAGPFYESPHLRGADQQTRLDLIAYQADWIANASRHLMVSNAWDLYFLQWWWTDMSGHAYLHRVDPSVPGYDEATGRKYWNSFKDEYAQCDRLVGQLVADASDDTVIVVVSDHGMLNGTTVFINNVLRQAGLLTLTTDAEGNPVVDWTRTRAFAQRSVYIYVNVKGRDPQGIVAPGQEYEQVRSRVIDALNSLRDPDTGRRAVALAVRSEEGGIVGVHRSEHVGDIVYLMAEGFGTMFPFSEDQVYGRDYRGFGNTGDWRRTEALFGNRIWSHHGSQLPGLTYGLSSEKAIFIMAGPGVKQGEVLPGPVWIIDAAPTVASLLGIPKPAQASGRVLQEALAP